MSEYSTQNAKGQVRADWEDMEDNGQLGDWVFLRDEKGPYLIMLRTPDGSERGYLSGLPLRPLKDPGPHWDWDGNENAPTLTPSILRYPTWHRPGWHGFMRAGALESC